MNNKNNLNDLSSQIDKANVGISYKKPKYIFMCGTIVGAGFAINEAVKVINQKNSKQVQQQNSQSKEVFTVFLKTKNIL